MSDFFQATTKAQPDIHIKEADGVPIWIIIVSVIGGLILLIVLVILLWKVGKKSSVTEIPEYFLSVET